MTQFRNCYQHDNITHNTFTVGIENDLENVFYREAVFDLSVCDWLLYGVIVTVALFIQVGKTGLVGTINDLVGSQLATCMGKLIVPIVAVAGEQWEYTMADFLGSYFDSWMGFFQLTFLSGTFGRFVAIPVFLGLYPVSSSALLQASVSCSLTAAVSCLYHANNVDLIRFCANEICTQGGFP